MSFCKLGLTLLGVVVYRTVFNKSHSISVRRRVSVLSVEFKLKTKAKNIAPVALLAFALLFVSGPSIAQSETDPELAKYIEVLSNFQKDVSSRLTQELKKPAPADESIAQKIDHLQKMQELTLTIEEIGTFIRDIKANGLPENRE